MGAYEKKSRSLPWGSIIPAAFFSVILVAVALYFSGYDLSLEGKFFSGSGAIKKNAFSDISKSPSLGRPDAPVTMIVFSDFQCSLCSIFHFGSQEAIIETYVKRGLVRFAFKHYPTLGEESFTAAYASECAREQGKFWEYQDLLFEKQSQSVIENSGIFSSENLVRVAEEIGLEKNMFEQCLSSGQYKENILRDLEEGKAAGVQGTPTVFVNNEKMEGSLPFETYKTAIEKIAGK